MESITNKVASSSLLTIDPSEWYTPGERVSFDLKPWLFEELILKEKDFRQHIKTHNWQQYTGRLVAVFCSADAIIPTWAFMLIASALTPYAKFIFAGTPEEMEKHLFSESIKALDAEKFRGQKVVIKGCAEKVPASAYVELTVFLRPLVKSIMFGEPCSTVPVFKSANEQAAG